MLKLLRHLLFLGVILGLAGNGVASASPACHMMTQHSAAVMADTPNCDMGTSCPDCGSKTSKGMKPGCMMMAGCAVTLAMKEPAPAAASARLHQKTAFWPVTTVLTGRIVPPEPEPPTLLG